MDRLADQEMEVDEAIVNQLGLWRLLHGVPFAHLVPDERMLPVESIRFFHVDPDWIACFLQGACSPGRSISRKADSLGYIIESMLIRKAEQLSAEYARRLRSSRLGLPHTENAEDLGNDINGFLLRSEVVEGWKNLGVNAYPIGKTPLDKNTQRLKLLRFERLAPSILLALFQGTAHQVDIHEAPQGLHFGVDTVESRSAKFLKYNQATGVHRLGDPLDGPPVPVPFRDEARRVVDIHKLSCALRQALDEKLGPANITNSVPLVSTDFALQMIQGVGMVTFLLDAEPHGKK
jgi:hypothetical protein